MYALNLDKDTKRILSATSEEYAPAEQPRVIDLPEGNISDYKYIDEEYVYDPIPEPPEPSPTIGKLRADIDYIAMVEDIDLDE